MTKTTKNKYIWKSQDWYKSV